MSDAQVKVGLDEIGISHNLLGHANVITMP